MSGAEQSHSGHSVTGAAAIGARVRATVWERAKDEARSVTKRDKSKAEELEAFVRALERRAPDSPRIAIGRVDWYEQELRIAKECRHYGSDARIAARSKDSPPLAATGTYWLKLTKRPHLLLCDFTTEAEGSRRGIVWRTLTQAEKRRFEHRRKEVASCLRHVFRGSDALWGTRRLTKLVSAWRHLAMCALRAFRLELLCVRSGDFTLTSFDWAGSQDGESTRHTSAHEAWLHSIGVTLRPEERQRLRDAVDAEYVKLVERHQMSKALAKEAPSLDGNQKQVDDKQRREDIDDVYTKNGNLRKTSRALLEALSRPFDTFKAICTAAGENINAVRRYSRPMQRLGLIENDGRSWTRTAAGKAALGPTHRGSEPM